MMLGFWYNKNMAIQDKALSAAEHDWFATRSELPANATLIEHKMKYFADRGFGSNASIRKPLSQQEREWLQNISGSTSNNEGDLWREAVSAQATNPSVSTSENKFKFYTQVGGNP